MNQIQKALREIPAMDQLLIQFSALPQYKNISHQLLRAGLRMASDQIRSEIVTGRVKSFEKSLLQNRLDRNLADFIKPGLRKVINGTGVVLHTNLGRAPLSDRARQQVAAVMSGYSSLEYDLEKGERGSRYDHVVGRLTELTGAEAALIVNNNAAAVLLVLSCLSKGRETLVSRGELVEIGGSFRVPDVMNQSGAVLYEVGTTNKTHIADYERGIRPETAAILRVHPSNFRIFGFTSSPTDREICELAHRKGIIALNDLGSGTLLPVRQRNYEEPTVSDCVSAGYDVVTFSGDKLLGAGQAGLIVGKKVLIDQMKKEPLLRALRIDKLSLAALEGTLIDYSLGEAYERIPVWRMLNSDSDELKEAARRLAKKLAAITQAGWRLEIVPTASIAGGGSLPAVDIDGFGVAIEPAGMSTSELEKLLRNCTVPIVVLVRDNRIVIDVRCLGEDEDVLCRQILELAK